MHRLHPAPGAETSRTALLMSLLSLAVPVIGSAVAPDMVRGHAGVLLWILPLLPAFLLSYYHGWKGASLSLAGGMAALAVTESGLTLAGRGAPSPGVLLGVVGSLIVVALGSGWLAEAFRSALRRAQAEAFVDPGTGAPNRRALTAALERAFYAAKRGGHLCVVLFDLDHFKSINDTYGHGAGDEVIRSFAEILTRHTRAMNISGRYGGEEFLAVLERSEADGAFIFADRVRAELEGADLPAEHVTVSAGIAQYEPGMAGPDVLVAAADQALYHAKNAGRNRVEILRPSGRRTEAAAGAPVAASDASEGSEASDAPDAVRRILVVDDDGPVRSALARALRRGGYDVRDADSAARAVEVLSAMEHRLDLVVSDIVMPDIQGFRMVEMLEEIQPNLRAVYISGYSPEEMDWGGAPGSAWAFLGKPVDLEQLVRVVEEVLARPVAREEGVPQGPPDLGAVAPSEPEAAPGPDFDDHDAPTLVPVLGEWDDAALAASVAVLDPRGVSPVPDVLRAAGFWNVRTVAEPGSPGRPVACDLLVADLATSGRGVEELVGPGNLPGPISERPALLLLSGSESGPWKRRVRGHGLVEVLERPVDGVLLASAARNLLRVRKMLDEVEWLRGISRSAPARRASIAEAQDTRLQARARTARAE